MSDNLPATETLDQVDAPSDQVETNPAESAPSGESATPAESPAPDVDPEAPFGRRADGTPKKSRAGRPRKDEAAQAQATQTKARLSSVSRAAPRPQTPPPIAPAQAMRADYEAVGRSFASLWFGLGTMLLGPDWQPTEVQHEGKTYREADQVAEAFTAWARSKDLQAVDPTVALSITLLSYAAIRAKSPEVRGRVARGIEWVKNGVTRLIRKR